jgi:hypothetical protein
MDVAFLGNDVAQVNADAEGDLLFLRRPGVALDHRPLHGDRAGHRLDHARELDQ